MGFFRSKPSATGEHTGEDIARQLQAGTLSPVHAKTHDAFCNAVAGMLRTGRPVTVKDAATLKAWFGPVDELPADELDG